MRIDIATLFVDMCQCVMDTSILGRAQKSGALTVRCHNIRDYTTSRQARVDDAPYGGGMGMVMQADPIYRCWEAVCAESGSRPYCIYLSPQGKVFDQHKARQLAKLPQLFLLCGHYEGVDERVLEEIVDEELSAGDFVLTGGELPALLVADAVARLCPGVLSDAECFTDESLYAGLLEHPQYTRPAVWHDRAVPEVLLSGHHKNIVAWRLEQSLRRTWRKRPDLLEQAVLTDEELAVLRRVQAEEAGDAGQDEGPDEGPARQEDGSAAADAFGKTRSDSTKNGAWH